MCHFISWIEHNDHVYFLDDDKMKTERGKKLKEYLNGCYWEDVKGHGAIIEFYQFDRYQGIHKEKIHIYGPHNVPTPIARSILDGKFRSIGRPDNPMCILTDEAVDAFYQERRRIWNWQDEEHDKLYRIREDKIADAPISDLYEIHTEAYREYEKAASQLHEEVQQKLCEFFWDLFEDWNNRLPEWQVMV